MSIACNVLIIGKTGTGKSSFANYLFDVDKFTIGSGEPVTSWAENFQAYHFEKKGIKINVYDSVGLEPDNQTKWMETKCLNKTRINHGHGMKRRNQIKRSKFEC